jgi:ADP-heptose:LPS heptosyltransferase
VREECDMARRITESRAWPNVVDWTGQLTLIETAALIARADLFIGADSGPAHLAAAVGTPAMVLFSGTNRVEQWRPWGSHVTVLRHETACSPCHRQSCPWADHPCMSRLTPSEVLRHLASFEVSEIRIARNDRSGAELPLEVCTAALAVQASGKEIQA